MRLSNSNKKMTSILLATSFSLQSCAVYKKNMTLNEAENAKLKTLIVTTDNVKHKYYRIVKIDDKYYGETKGKTKKTLLSENEIKSIRVFDKTATTIRYTEIILVTLGTAILINSLDSALDINIEDKNH